MVIFIFTFFPKYLVFIFSIEVVIGFFFQDCYITLHRFIMWILILGRWIFERFFFIVKLLKGLHCPW
jgi:hypothetical protein